MGSSMRNPKEPKKMKDEVDAIPNPEGVKGL